MVSPLFLTHVPRCGVGRNGEGGTTGVVLQCLLPLTAQDPLEWPSSGLGTSSIDSEKKKQTQSQAMDQSLYLELLGKPSILSLDQTALSMRALVMLHHDQVALGGRRASVTGTNCRYFVIQFDSKLLKMRNTWKSIHTLNSSGETMYLPYPTFQKNALLWKKTWKFKLCFIFCQHTFQAITLQ